MEKSRITKSNLTLFLVAAALVSLRIFFSHPSPDPELSKYLNKSVSFDAVISDEPDVRDSTVHYIASLENTDSKILLVSGKFPEYRYGDKIKVSGRLNLPKNFQTDSGLEFDYVHYLAKDNIYFLIYQPDIVQYGNDGNSVIRSLINLKNNFGAAIARVVTEPNASLIDGLIFGAKSQIGQELLTEMKNVGLIHIVAVSGYNVTIIATAILSITSYLRRRKLGLILSAGSIVLFAIMVGLGSTVIRASIMALVAILGRYLGRETQALRALFLAVFAMLLWNPLLLFYDPSFQLSAMATLGLILFTPIIYKIISTKFNWIPVGWGVREIISSTFGVQIFLLPLLLKLSGILSLISFAINLIILPIIPTTMLLGFLTGAAGMLPIVGKFISWPFGLVSYLFTEFIIRAVEFATKIPFAFLQTGSLPTWIMFLWYLIYALAFRKFSSMTDQLRLEKKSSI